MILRVGITGGIGSGKTTVCKIFESIGIPVYYADIRAKFLMNHNPDLKSKIKDLLGKNAYHRNGRLNRQYVAKRIFSNQELLELMNNIVHPAVHHDGSIWFDNLKEIPYALYEAALLVENGSYRDFDKIIVVTAPESLRISRVVRRDKSDPEDVARRIRSQLPESEKVKIADYIIVNDETQSIIQSVISIHKRLLNEINGKD